MGTYIQLDCLDCEQSLSFGKPISRGDMLTLRLFSQNDNEWHSDITCWHAMQVFLFEHIRHKLIFRTDDTSDASAFGEQVEFDYLLEKWSRGVAKRA